MKSQTDAESFLQGIVSRMLGIALECIEVVESLDDRGTLLTLSVPPDQIRFVIGREGSTANSLRMILRCWGKVRDKAVSIVITNPK